MIAEIVEAQCDLTLAEIAERFEEATGRSVRTKTVERSLTRSEITRKKVMTASEQHRPDVVAARTAFREAQLRPAAGLDASRLVFVDEGGVNVKLTRRYGRAHRSRRAVGHAPAA